MWKMVVRDWPDVYLIKYFYYQVAFSYGVQLSSLYEYVSIVCKFYVTLLVVPILYRYCQDPS